MEGRPKPREVHVRTWREAGYVCISVGDTGPGIPREHREQVFDTFFTTKGERGTGLGLAAVKNIMRRHNGDVVLGERPGGGAEFMLKFPLGE
jgi:signal transduction histidine kinase